MSKREVLDDFLRAVFLSATIRALLGLSSSTLLLSEVEGVFADWSSKIWLISASFFTPLNFIVLADLAISWSSESFISFNAEISNINVL